MQTNFFGNLAPQTDMQSLYKTRRKELITAIQQKYTGKAGAVLLFAAFETGPERFRQDKTFYYYTGINEPGTVLVIDMDGKSTLYVPFCFKKRAQWMNVAPAFLAKDAKALGVDACEFLGNECEGYGLDSYFSVHEYENMLTFLKNIVERNDAVFTTLPNNGHEYLTTRLIMNHLQSFIPDIQKHIVDVADIIAAHRRHKDVGEIEKIYRAIEITMLAHEAATQAIKDGVLESEVQASLEYMMTASHARLAFPSIVATGKNGTILHYSDNNGLIKNGDLVLVDIGAELHNYCADITRTYPVSGTFTKRQKELYNFVLETQEYVAGLAKPGMWLKNPKNPDKSLHHLAHAFLAKRGYADYFPHGIGHFLGLNVHDVGDYAVPLHEGDVITIEPGIYVPQEGIGIRIEDNYWIAKDGAICLSEDMPKTAEEIEAVMQQALSDEESFDEKEYAEDDEEEDYE
jgi:Xaa-Pro aminopeptidase